MAINKTHCLLIINCVGPFKNKVFQVSKQFLPLKYHIYQIVKVPEIKNTCCRQVLSNYLHTVS